MDIWQIIGIFAAVCTIIGVLIRLLKHMTNLAGKPKLTLSHSPDVKNWHFLDTGELRRFVTFEVINTKGQTARRCVAKVRIMKHPAYVTHLQQEYPLHWADIPYSSLSTGAEPVEIGAEPRRLDVAFSIPSQAGKSWIAMPIALSFPGKIQQAELPQGNYVLKVIVSCENGQGDNKTVKLISTNNWQDLQAMPT